MTEDWELEFRTQHCEACGTLYCEENGITKRVHTGFNTVRTLHFCSQTCLEHHHIRELNR